MAARARAAAAKNAVGLSTGGIVFFGGLCAGTFGLGGWQAKRFFEKVELVERRERELAMPPVELEPHAMMSKDEFLALSDKPQKKNSSVTDFFFGSSSNSATDDEPNEQRFRRVHVSGEFRHEDEILVGPRGPPLDTMGTKGPMSGRSGGGMGTSPMGYFVITPLTRSEGHGTILVNRGWVPMMYEKKSYDWERPLHEVQIVGVTTQAEKPRFFSPEHTQGPRKLLWFDRDAIEEFTNTKGISPLIVSETSAKMNDDSSTITFPAKPVDTTVGEFKVLPETHAGYAFTWFGLSGAGIIMTRKMMMRGRG